MSKGDGDSGGRMAAGGVGGRAAAIASLLVGGAVLAGAGYLLIRHTGKGFVKTAPEMFTEAMFEAVMANAASIQDGDVLVSTAGTRVAEAMRTEAGELVVPVATGKQIKRSLKLVQPTYEELAGRINLDKVFGTGGEEGRKERDRRYQKIRRIRQRLVPVIVRDLNAQKKRG